VVDVIWITAIALTSGVASYLSRWFGLVWLTLVVLAALELWGMTGGSPIVLVAIIVPAIVGFGGGRIIRKARTPA